MADEREVLSSLPRTRPTRRSAKRAAAAGDGRAGGAKQAAAKGKARAAAKRQAARPKSARKAGTSAKAAAGRRATPPPAGYATPEEARERSSAPDPLTTAVQAAGELAQIGIAAGGQALKGILSRLPRP